MSPLKFEHVGTTEDADIDIAFGVGDHSDLDPETRKFDEPFDGEGETLAHAYFPFFGGNVHFDDDEDWSVYSDKG